MKKLLAVLVVVLLTGFMLFGTTPLMAEDAAQPAAPAEVAAPAEPAAPAVEPVAVMPADDAMGGMDSEEYFDEAKVLRDAAAKLKGMSGDAEAQKLAGQLEELASDYEY